MNKMIPTGICARCKSKGNITIVIAGQQAAFCAAHYSDWLGYRDSVLGKCFGEYIAEGDGSKSKKPN